MPDDGRFSDEEMEQGLRDLGARMGYPPTPDVAGAVRRDLDEEAGSTRPRRALGWPPFLAPRWTAVAAALVVVCVIALSPTLRTTLLGPFTAGPQAGSAANPEGAGSENRHKQEEAAGAPAADQGQAARTCPPASIEASPARAAAGKAFRLRGHGLSAGCDGSKPARNVEILFRQDGRTWRLTTLEADQNAAFEAELRVPTGARPGPARVQTILPTGERAEERFVVLR